MRKKMRNNSIIFISLFLIFNSCKEDLFKKTKFTTINNTEEKCTIGIYDYDYNIIKKILINAGARVTDTLNIKEGYYFLKENGEYNLLYLKPSHELNLHIENNTIRFSGIGGNENNYLLEKDKLISSLPSTAPSSSSYTSLTERKYLHLVNSNYNKKVIFLNKFENLEKDFIQLETESVFYDKMVRLVFYESNLQYLKNDKSFKVSDNFPKLYDNLNLTNEKLLNHFNYHFYVYSFLKIKVAEKLKINPLLDEVITTLKTTNEEIENTVIREKLIFWRYEWDFVKSKDLDKAYKVFNSSVKNEKYRNIIKQKYLKTKNIGKGDISPIFNFKDLNNNLVSLSDFKGNIIYIDIWNTYCKPCIIEMPKFEKMKKEFSEKKIKFVSICVNSPKGNWKRMITKKNLTGIQLYSEKANGSFFKKYMFNSAPRYILIDKEGKIIESHARKPSDTKLIKIIENYLK
jgi:thiol-disulfide isomerase/thioredoxin